MRNLIIGVGASVAFGIVAVALARFWGIPLAIYLAPAAVVDHPIGAPLFWLVRQVLPEGGPPGAFLLVMGTAFLAWTLLFTLVTFVVRRRRVAVV